LKPNCMVLYTYLPQQKSRSHRSIGYDEAAQLVGAVVEIRG